jgi:hypothetical protein
VWRLKDTNNYHVARANALEDDVTAALRGAARRSRLSVR